jgi:hypothetical protein
VQVNKLNFSHAETVAMLDQEFFLLKSSAIEKVVELFGTLERGLQEKVGWLDMNFEDVNISNGKIFRGENYKKYPYVVLDYPRQFSTQSIFAFRTMFWWGHEFSFTLHLQGDSLEKYRKTIFNNSEKLIDHDVFFCVNDTPWQYLFEKENYVPIEELTNRSEELLTKPFLKLSRRLPVDAQEKVQQYCYETFKLFMELLK